MKVNYDLIVLVQSYPNLIDSANFALSHDNKKEVLILVVGDRKIYKFLKETIKKPNITIKRFGSYLFLDQNIYTPYYHFTYVIYILEPLNINAEKVDNFLEYG